MICGGALFLNRPKQQIEEIEPIDTIEESWKAVGEFFHAAIKECEKKIGR